MTRDDEAVRGLVDRLAISDVLVAYAVGIDGRDWPAVEACFRPDAHIVGSRLEAPFAQYFPFLRTEIEKFGRTVHSLANHRSVVDGTVANAETYASAVHYTAMADGALAEMSLGVVYRDRLEFDDGWRIVRREVTVQWIREIADVSGTVQVPGLPDGRLS